MTASWFADKIEQWPTAKLLPYARNARTHSDEQVAQIAASIAEFGFTNPILAGSDGVLVAGHGRLAAAQKLGLEVVPVVVLDHLTPTQRRALVLADNKLALNAGWNLDLLASELSDLREMGADLSVVGFSSVELEEIFRGKKGARDPDDAPPVADRSVSELGDIWVLGAHRLVCGSATTQEAYAALLGGESVDAIWTDPPYNVDYHGRSGSILNDSMPDARFREFLLQAFSAMFAAARPGAAIYVAHADTEGLNFRSAFASAGFKLASCVIWRKDALVMGRSDYQWQHEPILYGWKPGAAHRWFGGRKQTTIVDLESSPFTLREDGRWQIRVGDAVLVVDGQAKVEELVPTVIHHAKPKRSDLHPTMKPVALIERTLRHSAQPGDLVLDPFGGSGSTLIAAEQLGMRARLIELDPKYVDVIVRRWQDYDGAKAIRLSDGVAFDALSVGGELRQEVAAGDVGAVSDVAEFAGVIGEDDPAD